MAEPFPSRVADKFMLRLPDGMRDEIAAIAKANGRSMNTEIVHRLAASLASGATPSPASRPDVIAAVREEGRKVEALLQKIERKLAKERK